MTSTEDLTITAIVDDYISALLLRRGLDSKHFNSTNNIHVRNVFHHDLDPWD